jgi:dUTP pyrophosphatase
MHRIHFKKLVPEAVEPERVHDNDAGFDMVAISKKETDRYIQYGTGIAMEIPDGMVGLIFPRSSVTKKQLMLKNSVGVIDAGYRGEISFRFQKTIKPKTYSSGIGVESFTESVDDYKIGDKIGQIIFQTLPDVVLLETDELEDTERGEGGYGSTDKVIIPEVNIDNLKKLNEGT